MPRVIWSSGNCMLYVRAGEPSASERERGREGETSTREGEGTSLGRACEKSRLIRVQAGVSRDGRERKRARGRRGRRCSGEGKGAGEGEVREEEPREVSGERGVEGDVLVEEGCGKGGGGGERATRECVRMLSADSSRPGDHTRRDHRACLRTSFANIYIYPRSGGAAEKCVSLYYIFLRERVPRLLLVALEPRESTLWHRCNAGLPAGDGGSPSLVSLSLFLIDRIIINPRSLT